MEPQIQLTWYGHSCFLAEAGGWRIVLDPYGDGSVPGLPPLRLTAEQVLCSHAHRDHAARENVTLVPAAGESPFSVTALDCFHDSESGRLRGENRIHVLEYRGLRLAHLGDLGHPLTPAQRKQLGRLDAVLIPVGGYYTVGPAEAGRIVQALDAPCVIPMHYRAGNVGYAEIGTVEAFLALRGDVRRLPGSSVILTAGMPRETLVFASPAIGQSLRETD